MYGFGLSAGKGSELRQERQQQVQRLRAERRATTLFPDLPIDQALQQFEQWKQGYRETAATQKEAWPIFAAIGAGLLVMTFLGKKRRR